jgi:chromosome transmission fidelity protein 8
LGAFAFKGKPTLRIGHHLLEGKIVSLPKPLAVLQRVCAPPPPLNSHDEDADADAQADDTQHGSNGDTTTTSYAIRTLIRKKIVFSKRPTPIVGLSAKIT